MCMLFSVRRAKLLVSIKKSFGAVERFNHLGEQELSSTFNLRDGSTKLDNR